MLTRSLSALVLTVSILTIVSVGLAHAGVLLEAGALTVAGGHTESSGHALFSTIGQSQPVGMTEGTRFQLEGGLLTSERLAATVRLVPETDEFPLGGKGTVQVLVAGAPPVSAFEATVQYDGGVLQVQEADDVASGAFLSSTGRSLHAAGPDIVQDNPPARVLFGYASSGSSGSLPSGNGILATIAFTAVGEGVSVLELTEAKLLDAHARPIPLSLVDSSVRIGRRGDVDGNGTVNEADASLLLRFIVGLIDAFPAQQTVGGDAVSVGDVSGDGSISALDAYLILSFAVGQIASFPVDSPSAAPALLASVPYELSMRDVQTKAGQRVSVPVQIQPAPSSLAGTLALRYDPAVLKVHQIISTNGLVSPVWRTDADGQIHLGFATPGDTREDKPEALLSVDFDVLPTAESRTYPVTFEDVDLAGGLSTQFHDGSIRVVPSNFALLPNYPNPFNPETWFPYELPVDADVAFRIYSPAGHLIRELNLGRREAGAYTAAHDAAYWDGRNSAGQRVSSGTYFYQFLAGEFRAVRRMVIVK